ncbi:MAG: hypothetical protein AB1589_29635 [Cyanobacteriota bacterium]
MNNQLTLQIAIQYPVVFGLAKVRSNSSVKAKKNKALRKIIEFAVIAFAGFINPEAANWAVPVLKLCFLLLHYQQQSR